MGHMEACAAAAGLASLLSTPLSRTALIAPNAQLRRLNAHLVSLVSASRKPFRMPVEVVPRAWRGSDDRSGADDDSRLVLTGRLSSFGFSGTIAHGLFALKGVPNEKPRDDMQNFGGVALYRSRRVASVLSHRVRVSLRAKSVQLQTLDGPGGARDTSLGEVVPRVQIRRAAASRSPATSIRLLLVLKEGTRASATIAGLAQRSTWHCDKQTTMVLVLSQSVSDVDALAVLLLAGSCGSPMVAMASSSCCNILRAAARAMRLERNDSRITVRSYHSFSGISADMKQRLGASAASFDETLSVGLVTTLDATVGISPKPHRKKSNLSATTTHIITGAFGALGRAISQTILTTTRRRDSIALIVPSTNLMLSHQSHQSTVSTWYQQCLGDGTHRMAMICSSLPHVALSGATDMLMAGHGAALKLTHCGSVAFSALATNETSARLLANLGADADNWRRTLYGSNKIDAAVIFSSLDAVVGQPGPVSHAGANALLDNAAATVRRLGGAACSIRLPGIGLAALMAGELSSPDTVSALWSTQSYEMAMVVCKDLFSRPTAIPDRTLMCLYEPAIVEGLICKKREDISKTVSSAETKHADASEPNKQSSSGRKDAVTRSTSSSKDVHAVVISCVEEFVGKDVGMNTPLMSAGLDSIGAAEFTRTLSQRLEVDIPQTVLFDHPTCDSLVSYLTSVVEGHQDGGECEIEEESTQSSLARPSGILMQKDTMLPSMLSISIASVSFELPGGLGSAEGAELRQLVSSKHVTSSKVPADRWLTPTPGAAGSAAYGSFMGSVLPFDASMFGISVTEARSMCPQQSFVLQVGYRAVSRNGTVSRDKLMKANIGVFLGIEPSGTVCSRETATGYSVSGGSSSVAAGRLSFTLGLVGPCLSIDTACASALVAMHVGSTAVGRGECPSSVAAGTKVLTEESNLITSIAGMISTLGRCHSFDERADGYCRGEGCVAILLVATDRTYTPNAPILLGTAVQQDGPSASLTAPNGSSQKRLLQTVQHALDEDPRGLHLEAHGTGTALGDPIEVGAAVGALCRSSKAANVQREVQCSSLKANMGHMEACAAAAGLASLLSASLCRTPIIAPNAQLRRLNSHIVSLISASGQPFRMPVEVVARIEWDTTVSVDVPHLVGRLSSFGFNGTIAHGLFASAAVYQPVGNNCIMATGPSLFRNKKIPAARKQKQQIMAEGGSLGPTKDAVEAKMTLLLEEVYGCAVELNAPLSEFDSNRKPTDKDLPFFASGLKSSSLPHLIGDVNSSFSVSLSVTQIFENPTVNALSSYLKAHSAHEDIENVLCCILEKHLPAGSGSRGMQRMVLKLEEELGVHIDSVTLSHIRNGNQLVSAVLELLHRNPQADGDLHGIMRKVAQSNIPIVRTSTYQRCPRPVIIVLAGSNYERQNILNLLMQKEIFVMWNACILPFNAIFERSNFFLDSRTSEEDRLAKTIAELRNCTIEEAVQVISSQELSTASAMYLQLQEWCAPRILVDAANIYKALLAPVQRSESIFALAHYLQLVSQASAHVDGSVQESEDAALSAAVEPSRRITFHEEVVERDAAGPFYSWMFGTNANAPIVNWTTTQPGQLERPTSTRLSSEFLMIRPDAVGGALVWLRRGDVKLPTVVIVHGAFGIPSGNLLSEYLTSNVSIIALQAPELASPLRPTITGLGARVACYAALLASELAAVDRRVCLVCYSHGAYLGLNLLECLDQVGLHTVSLCMVDPEPFSPHKSSSFAYLSTRAAVVDEFLSNAFSSQSNFYRLVKCGRISSVSQLEQEVASTFPAHYTELSRIVDYFLLVNSMETENFNYNQQARVSIPTVFFKCSGGTDFYRDLQYAKWKDEFYGWGQVLHQITAGPLVLEGGHHAAFSTHRNLSQIAAVLSEML